MKLSSETIAILKNFGSINQGIFFQTGNILKTVSVHKNILAQAKIPEDIPCDFGIYDLNNFLSVVTLHKEEPSFDFSSKYAVIKGRGGRSKIKYRFCDPTMIVLPPDKDIVMPTPEINFELTSDDFSWIMKSAAILASPQISVESEGGSIYIKTIDVKNDSAHTEALEICDGNGANYKMIFRTENLAKVLPGSYDVSISSKGIALFKNKSINLHYWVTIEQGSFYNEIEG